MTTPPELPLWRSGWELLGLVMLVVVPLVALASCANPVAPSGGPRDETPPSVALTRPKQDSVNVSTDTRSVYIEFSEYIERSSLVQSLSVTPQFEGRLRFDWSGRGVEIELPSSLRDSTTYLFSLDTNLSDAHGVSLEEPITVAFATGPRINQGELRGRVVRPAEGTPVATIDVFAYAVPASAPPDSLPEQPAYRTQTGEDGTFSFSYMREQPYYVVAVRDNNRNLRPDPTESYAVPPRPILSADTTQAAIPVPWLLTRADTLRPRFRTVQPLSRQRVRLSFSEPIQLPTPHPRAWTLRDSVSNSAVAVRAVYQPAERNNALILRTAPMDSTRHLLPLSDSLVTDTLGQALRPDTARFQAVTRPDTTQTRFQTFIPEARSPDSTGAFPLLPGDRPGIRFNQAPDSSTLRQVLSLQDTTGQSQPFSWTTDDGRTYRLHPETPISPGALVEVGVAAGPIVGPDTTYRRLFRRVTDQVLGALEGRATFSVATRQDSVSSSSNAPGPLPGGTRNLQSRPPPPSDTTAGAAPSPATPASNSRDTTARGPIVVEIIPTESRISLDSRQQTIAPGSTFVFEELPEGTFRFRAFQDLNENGRWDGGLIEPYAPAETVTWSEQTTDSRPRWTNVISAPLRLPILAPPSPSTPAPAPDTTATDSLDR